ncbi:MAG: glycine cleavage system aminomethyltransferase GcvT [Candidatus Omnitrophica bacterium]|nr:glycine cleavage system aminomethyltransferase GcvT [Candidatus Omnitrophota bacterium]MBU1127476.1 glycine cleavage system aminomethyltransferase GcvT [Candidatus Omnitrophota bacterium]MBU1785050.1 glycine cleavage system aminomethyltransferase GcvT [Candidatus Omnitrophota bacterium]MBU1851884.1 glycine cleavage system aminomethyltransferase GcvT [Candidatus Omnitrophota bacterium]
MSIDTALKKTPLYNKHLEAGARMVPFAGWSMPVQYTGIIEEHLHTRSRASLFDICHMSEFFVKGPSAEKDVDALVTCCIDGLGVGKCRYGFLLNNDGVIIDDMIVFKITPEEFMIVGNSGTRKKDSEWIRTHLSQGSDLFDDSNNIAKIDLQGPRSMEVMRFLAGDPVIRGLGRFSFARTRLTGINTMVSRTGYTGENGYEIFLPAAEAGKLWDVLTRGDSVKPAGLGARDSLRLEIGYSLYGHDIDDTHTPAEAGLMRFVHLEKEFIGRERLLKQLRKGIKSVLTGFICSGRRSAREHYRVTSRGREVGVVTSGAFSPCLKRGIGLCYVDKDAAGEGKDVVLINEKIEINAKLKTPPFLKTGN